MKEDNRLTLEKLRYNLFACPPFASMIGVQYMINSNKEDCHLYIPQKYGRCIFARPIKKYGCIYGKLNFSRINDKILKPSAKVQLTY